MDYAYNDFYWGCIPELTYVCHVLLLHGRCV